MKPESPLLNALFCYSPGNHGLTEDVIYEQQPTSIEDRFPIFSGSVDNETPMGWIQADGKNNEGKPLAYFQGPCIILTKDGSAGLLTYKGPAERFTINHHACVLTVKDEWKGELDLEWFAGQHQSLFFSLVTSRSDNRVFSTEWFERIAISVPDYHSVQLQVRKRRRALAKLTATVRALRREALQLLSQPIDESECPVSHAGVVSDVLDVLGGNSGLTDQFIYENQPMSPADSIEVLSGATLPGNDLGPASRYARPKGKKLKIVDRESILLSRKGFYAGVMRYIGHREVAINDDAYLLVPKKGWEKRLNLRWFSHQYSLPLRACVTSQTDNATFNQQWLHKLPVRIPEKEAQDREAAKLAALENLDRRLERLEVELRRLLSVPIGD